MARKKGKKAKIQKAIANNPNNQKTNQKTALSAILLVVLCTALASSAQIFYKLGSKTLITTSLGEAFRSAFFNINLWAGLLLYGIGAILLIIALKKGELSILYPIIALSYVWVSLLSMRFLGEQMSMLKWLGVLTIIIGVSLIGIGSQQNGNSAKKKQAKKGRRAGRKGGKVK